ncbi:hypothetical protein AOPFMNJM_1687 [Methylobacterium jeotgali]|uniref:Uncharacterized protein n=1 Tax=Methylobacterium jeotgali TaxID=381630 RepID=A0ABQ4ST63_9HYPH|nr:hypothetical protein [Methylobacterium jeotgali]GJE06371.1 hypothetical protein AOPFMNJM_1687 [Methylobacterium jeotgali]
MSATRDALPDGFDLAGYVDRLGVERVVPWPKLPPGMGALLMEGRPVVVGPIERLHAEVYAWRGCSLALPQAELASLTHWRAAHG